MDTAPDMDFAPPEVKGNAVRDETAAGESPLIDGFPLAERKSIVADKLPSRVRWGTCHVQHFLSRVVAGRCSIVETEAQMEKMFTLRYKIYIQELKKNLPWADHHGKRLPDPLDPDAPHFVVNRLGGQLVGCGRLHLGT